MKYLRKIGKTVDKAVYASKAPSFEELYFEEGEKRKKAGRSTDWKVRLST